MSHSIHPGAEQDVADAVDFYDQHAGPLVAARFLIEFERVVQLLLEHPGLGTPTTKGRRVFPLKIFPYSIRLPNSGNRHSHPDRAPPAQEARLRPHAALKRYES